MSFESILSRLEQAIPHADKVNLSISERGVAWHLEHSLKIIVAISGALCASKPEEFSPKFSITKYYILWTNKIPRGKGRSPKPFNNKEKIDKSKLPQLLKDAENGLASITNLPAKSFFPHPLFGDLKFEEAKTFIAIHTAHHLDIIDDIIKG